MSSGAGQAMGDGAEQAMPAEAEQAMPAEAEQAMSDEAEQAMSPPADATMSASWYFNEVESITSDDLSVIEQKTPSMLQEASRGQGVTRLAVRLRKVVCKDVQRWFGLGAQIRVDALVVQGDSQGGPTSYANGVIIFNGTPLHFIDIFVLVSRDRKESDDLGVLLSEQLNGKEGKAAMAALAALVAAPHAAAVVGAVAAAATLGNLTYKAIKAVSPKSIGMYRGSFLQFRDNFGVGRHPESDMFTHNDLEFWFDIVLDTAR
jgi:hypothetical protein